MATDPNRFTGFPAGGLRFLEELAKRNERDFFKPRKERYERDLLEPMRAFVAASPSVIMPPSPVVICLFA